jgi:hypothetical protein
MAKMIQIRNVPDRLHRELVKRARRRDVTLTRYIQDILEREVTRPPADVVFGRIEANAPIRLGQPAAALIREERAARGQD